MTRNPPRTTRLRWVGLGFLATAALFLLSLWVKARLSDSDDPRPDLESMGRSGELPSCPDTPNCVSSQSRDPQRVVEPIDLGDDPVAGFATLTRLVEQRATIERRASGAVHAVFRSRLFGFLDDVYLLLDEADGVAHVRSASRTGKSDLGANRSRVEDLRFAMRALLPPAQEGESTGSTGEDSANRPARAARALGNRTGFATRGERPVEPMLTEPTPADSGRQDTRPGAAALRETTRSL